MTTSRDWQSTTTEATRILRATVVTVGSGVDGFQVRCLVDEERDIICDLLSPLANSAVPLAPGDHVLVWCPSRDEGAAVVLGRIGNPRSVAREEVPDEVVLEANQSLTLRVGDGSITIREDGKILIKGKDLVSHATRMNRIKGGSVQIN